MSDKEEGSEPPLKKLRTDGGTGGGAEGEEGGGGQSPPSLAAKEQDVGITQFVSDHDGFFAVLKRRLGNLKSLQRH